MIELKTVSTIDALSERIESDIFSRYYAPGAKITENDLTRRYAVSRNTVREAIAYLLASGLLTKVANKGVYVRRITIDDVREIFTLRGLLEDQAVRAIVASGIIPAELSHLAEDMEAIDAVRNWAEYIEADIRFHKLLVESAGSPRLLRLYNAILAEVKLCVYGSRSFFPLKHENAAAHLRLLRAMEGGDLSEAISILHSHMEQAIASYELGFQMQEDGQ